MVHLSNNPFHMGYLWNPNHRAPNQQLTISWILSDLIPTVVDHWKWGFLKASASVYQPYAPTQPVKTRGSCFPPEKECRLEKSTYTLFPKKTKSIIRLQVIPPGNPPNKNNFKNYLQVPMFHSCLPQQKQQTHIYIYKSVGIWRQMFHSKSTDCFFF